MLLLEAVTTARTNWILLCLPQEVLWLEEAHGALDQLAGSCPVLDCFIWPMQWSHPVLLIETGTLFILLFKT